MLTANERWMRTSGYTLLLQQRPSDKRRSSFFSGVTSAHNCFRLDIKNIAHPDFYKRIILLHKNAVVYLQDGLLIGGFGR